MALLDDVKEALRENTIENEVQDLIDAAKADLALSGVHENKITDIDPLIKRAIILYCKAHFGYDDPKIQERFEDAYYSLKNHLALSIEYTTGDTS